MYIAWRVGYKIVAYNVTSVWVGEKKYFFCVCVAETVYIIIIIIIIINNNIIIELTHSKTIKTILKNTVEIEPQPVALDFKNLPQYSSRSK